MASTIQRKTFEWRQARVVVLILAGLALLAFAIYRVGKIFDVFADRYTIVTLLPNVAGLREGALVSLAGQRIGKVDEIQFIPLRAKRGDNHLLPQMMGLASWEDYRRKALQRQDLLPGLW